MAMKTFKIPFAFKDGELFDYNTAVKKVDYTCQCGEVVRIRGGEIMSNHFYHINETECCNESIIHKAYKSVFLNEKKILLPYDYNKTSLIEFDRVELEKKINDFVPDAIGYIGDKKYLIEFAKTSFIGERKLKKIKDANLFCIEVSILKGATTISEIKEHLVKESYYKEIVHAPEYGELKYLKEKVKIGFNNLRRKHKAELMTLEDKYNTDITELRLWSDLVQTIHKGGIRFEYKSDCKNGAKFYVSSLNDFIIFSKDGGITIKRNTRAN